MSGDEVNRPGDEIDIGFVDEKPVPVAHFRSELDEELEPEEGRQKRQKPKPFPDPEGWEFDWPFRDEINLAPLLVLPMKTRKHAVHYELSRVRNHHARKAISKALEEGLVEGLEKIGIRYSHPAKNRTDRLQIEGDPLELLAQIKPSLFGYPYPPWQLLTDEQKRAWLFQRTPAKEMETPPIMGRFHELGEVLGSILQADAMAGKPLERARLIRSWLSVFEDDGPRHKRCPLGLYVALEYPGSGAIETIEPPPGTLLLRVPRELTRAEYKKAVANLIDGIPETSFAPPPRGQDKAQDFKGIVQSIIAYRLHEFWDAGKHALTILVAFELQGLARWKHRFSRLPKPKDPRITEQALKMIFEDRDRLNRLLDSGEDLKKAFDRSGDRKTSG